MIPSPEAISHLRETIDEHPRHELPQTVDKQSSHTSSTPASTISSASFNAGLPPPPVTLVKHIQEGEFIDMSELTVDHLSMEPQDESSKPSHSRRRPVTSIIEWVQCFTQ